MVVIILTSCSSVNNEPIKEEERAPVVHTYFSIGDIVEGGTFDYTVNSVKHETSALSSEGHSWLVADVSFEDNIGDEGYSDYASMYGEFILIDDEHNIYHAYNKEQKTEFYGATRDFVLFLVPSSKTDFLLLDADSFFDSWSNIDDYARNIIKFTIEK